MLNVEIVRITTICNSFEPEKLYVFLLYIWEAVVGDRFFVSVRVVDYYLKEGFDEAV